MLTSHGSIFFQSKVALHPPRFWLPFTMALNLGLFFSSSLLLNTTWLEIPGVLKIKDGDIDNDIEFHEQCTCNFVKTIISESRGI